MSTKKSANKAEKKADNKAEKKAEKQPEKKPGKKLAKTAVAKTAAAKNKPAKEAAPAKSAAAKSKRKYQAKTVPTGESVDAHIAAIADPGRRQDCRSLVEVFSQATGKPAKMWGPSIVAFGKYHYTYASGHEGDSCLAGFASRKGALTLYLMGVVEEQKELMSKLGKHRTGKGCIYLKDLDGIDLQVLGELVKRSAEYIRARHPTED